MFNVTLYSLSKKENSTKLPSGGTPFSCTLKSPSGVVNPTLKFNVGLNSPPPANFNYCYIPEFGRYYWIEDWVNNGALWYATMNVDVLATYKDEIGNSDLYILRSSATWDGNVIDTFYPTKVNYAYNEQSKVTPWIHDGAQTINVKNGSVIIGITTERSRYGSVSYYALTVDNMATLTSNLLSNAITPGNGFDIDDCSLALQRSLINPLSFIVSAIWTPTLYTAIDGTEGSSLKVFDWDINVPNKYIGGNYPYRTHLLTFDIGKHPQTNSRGNYVNTTPFTINTLYYPPFGLIELDGSVLANNSTLICSCIEDYITGIGILDIRCGTYTINRLKAQIGVPLQLSQVTKDYVGAITSGISSGVNTIQNAIMGNIGGAITSLTNGIGEATHSLMPRVSHLGGNGGFSDLHGWAKLQQQFMIAVDDDINMCGRPLCQVRKPKNLNGYMLVQEGDVSANATSFELAKIKNYLEGGFYYE